MNKKVRFTEIDLLQFFYSRNFSVILSLHFFADQSMVDMVIKFANH